MATKVQYIRSDDGPIVGVIKSLIIAVTQIPRIRGDYVFHYGGN